MQSGPQVGQSDRKTEMTLTKARKRRKRKSEADKSLFHATIDPRSCFRRLFKFNTPYRYP